MGGERRGERIESEEKRGEGRGKVNSFMPNFSQFGATNDPCGAKKP